MRVGVTGHIYVEDDAELTAAIRDGLARVLRLAAGGPVSAVLVVVSALAEGADRLVTSEVIADRRNRLEVALPLPPDEYAADFAGDASKRQFQALLDRASSVWTAPRGGSREQAYERAGRHVVDHADAVIALWDGEPSRGRGGTAEIVAYARAQRVPLFIINPRSPLSVTDELDTPRSAVIRDAAEHLQRYNAARLSDDQSRVHEDRERAALGLAAPQVDRYATVPRAIAAERYLPFFVRADVLALRCQRRFQRVSAIVFFTAAFAVLIVALQTNVHLDVRVVFAEVVLLGLLILMPVVSRRSQLHERWISYRFLAERLRSAFFLSLIGTGDRQDPAQPPSYLTDPGDLWIKRVLEEAMSQMRRPEMETGELLPTREYLADCWIGGQITFHADRSRRHRRRDNQIVVTTAVLFAVSLLAAILHLVGLGPSWAETLVIVVSLSVPAFGAAVHGLGTLRQYRRNAERYIRMTQLLRELRTEMAGAESFEAVRRLAVDTERVMREENADWFGVMRFFDVELIA